MTWKSDKSVATLAALFVGIFAHAQDHTRATASFQGKLEGSAGAVVVVHLVPTTDNPVRYYEGFETVPRPDGSFSFAEIPPGKYTLSVEGLSQLLMYPVVNSGDRVRQQLVVFTLIFPADMPSGIVHLIRGEHRKGGVIQLTHKLSFCGHVTRDSTPKDSKGMNIGAPQTGPDDASLTYYHYNPVFRILENPTNFDTNKEGSFRVSDLPPGTYYLKVNGNGDDWFPGANSFSMAKPIVVGRDSPSTCDTDFPVQSPYGSYSALTTLSVVGGEKSDRYKAAFLERNAEGATYSGLLGPGYASNPMVADSTLSKIQAAEGALEAVLYDEARAGTNVWTDAPTQKVIFDSQPVTLKRTMDAAAQNSVVFRPHPMASIEGELVLENVTREEFCPNCQPVLISILREGNGEFQTVGLSKENHFDFHHVTPGTYELFVFTTRPDKAFLKSIVAAGQVWKGRKFTVRDAKFFPMTVTLSGNLAEATGHITPDARHSIHWETEGMRPRASISGNVIGQQGTGYTVRLLPVLNNNSPLQFTTNTGADGSFSFKDVPPGVYLLRAHDADYVRFDYGALAAELRGTPLLVRAGAHLNGLTLHAPHRNSICGHVTDENDDPQANTSISYRNGVQMYGAQPRPVTTDAAGYFRIDGLLADDYFLAALRNAPGEFLYSLSSDGKLTDFKPVHIEDGKDAGCGSGAPLALRLPTSTGRYSVSGIVTGDLPNRMGDRFEVQIAIADDITPYQSQSRRVALGDDRRFHFDNIPSGKYRITIDGLYGEKPSGNGFYSVFSGSPLRHLVASQAVSVSDKNLTDVTLVPRSLASVTGTVTIAKLTAPWNTIKTNDLSIALVPHGLNGVSTAVLTDAGEGHANFEFGAIDPGEYEVRIQSTKGFLINSALYVQSVTLNGNPIDRLLLHMPETGMVDLHVDLANNMASLHAHVAEGKAFTPPLVPLAEWCRRGGGNYQVVLLPASVLDMSGDNQPPYPSPRYESAWTMGDVCNGIHSWETEGFDGEVKNLSPGRYYALALWNHSDINLGVLGQGNFDDVQRKLWRELAKIATPVTLNPGEHLELHLDDKTIEALRIVAKVGIPADPENLCPSNPQGCAYR